MLSNVMGALLACVPRKQQILSSVSAICVGSVPVFEQLCSQASCIAGFLGGGWDCGCEGAGLGTYSLYGPAHIGRHVRRDHGLRTTLQTH